MLNYVWILLIGTIVSFRSTSGQFPTLEYGGIGEDFRGFSNADFGSKFFRGGAASEHINDGSGIGDFGRNVGYHNHPGQQSTGDENPEEFQSGRKVNRFVSVHIAPPEEPQRQRGPPPPTKRPDTNYQIVFIKAPSNNGPDGSLELQIPPPPETKTLVYVLLKKQALDLQKLKALQEKTKPQPPEVFFIRYKGNKGSSGGAGGRKGGPQQSADDGNEEDEGRQQSHFRGKQQTNNKKGFAGSFDGSEGDAEEEYGSV